VDYGGKVDDWLRMTRRLLESILMIMTALTCAMSFVYSARTTRANPAYGAFHSDYCSLVCFCRRIFIPTSFRRCCGYKA
jgi:hypothetical protein